MIGQTISHYRIVEKLGEGGMGVVYKAEDLKLGRAVALKFLPAHLLESQEHRARFLQEARAAALLDHPNICTVHEIDEADGQTFLAMACLEGTTLKQKIAERPLRLDEALDIAGQIGQGLQAAHEKGIVHRDIKPGNIVISSKGQAKILDFGLAHVAELSRVTKSETRLGTPAYMSPEQAEGRATDRRADIWSFGVVFYEMLTGQLPFSGEREQAIVHSILHEEPEPVTARRAGLPLEVDRLVGKALAKDPGERYQHVDDMLADLQVLRKAVRERKSGRSAAPLPAPESRTGRYAYWGAATLVLLIAGLGLWLAKPDNDSAQAPVTAEASLVPIPLTSDPGAESWPSFSPDGNQVVFDRQQPGGRHEIRVKLVGEGQSVHLADGCCPAWSPDGRSIAFFGYTGSLFFLKPETELDVSLISPLGGPERKLAAVHANHTPSLAWHPSGKWLVVTDKGSPAESDALFSLSMESGEKRRLTPPQDGSYDMYPAVSPDGEALVFGRGTRGSCCVLFLIELSEEFEPEGEPKLLTSENTSSMQAAWTPDGRAIVFASGTIHAPALDEMPFSRPGWRPGKTKRLAFAAEGVRTPAISRQGRLAYATSTNFADIWRLELNGPGRAAAPPKILIDSTRLDHDQEYSLDGKRIAFTSNRSGSYEIWVCNSDGSGAMQLTTLGGSLFTAGPHWSPDGRLILFRSNPEGDAETFVIDSDGGKPKLLFPNTGVSSWSHDGKWIYFAAKGQVWKRPWPPLGQDEEAIQITRKGGSFARESPNGKVLYYAKGDEDITSLWKVPVEGGEETQVLESVCWLNFAVVEEGIYFIPDWPPAEKPSVQYLSFATGKAATIATLSDFPGWGFSVSRDGGWLLYTQFQPTQGDLWMVENFR